MNPVSRTEWEVLNATADDWENLEQIYQTVRRETRPAGGELRAVTDSIRRLVEGGLLAARLEDGREVTPVSGDLSYVWRAWFNMTTAGREVWEKAEHSDLFTLPDQGA